ncbi:MAG: sigma-70 family RNA polymerase sigma factor [Acidobacteria bacterium]|nr:sigma-70 family RNA polymerase sigma factor [Acidobacteriota bacterium]
MQEAGSRPPRTPGRFGTTQWSLVIAAADPGDPLALEALTALCRAYWQPIYVYLRRRGTDREEALDLTQGFFAKLLEKNYLADARRERGRFRTFLLTALNHYVANEWDRERAQKRGGGTPPISIDAPQAETMYHREPSHDDTPERLFDRRWARTLLDVGLKRLREETARREEVQRFERLLPLMSGEGEEGYRDLAAELGVGESAIRVAVHRMRRRFRAILRDEVARTVGNRSSVDDELRHLFAVLGT